MFETETDRLRAEIIKALERSNLSLDQYRMLIDAYSQITLFHLKYDLKRYQFNQLKEDLKAGTEDTDKWFK